MVLGGADLATVKEILGHSTTEMTTRYSRPTPDSKLKAVIALSMFRMEEPQDKGHLKTLTTRGEFESATFCPLGQSGQITRGCKSLQLLNVPT